MILSILGETNLRYRGLHSGVNRYLTGKQFSVISCQVGDLADPGDLAHPTLCANGWWTKDFSAPAP